ncbi:MAG: HAMP domain-containing histidine kinase [Flavobacteriaceae bacterium]|nr:HAMP domain-containing histidine kinase [Flavobacteriaceae bacterium]
MLLPNRKNATSYLLVIGSFAIVSLILWNTNAFFKKFKEEEQRKIALWAAAQAEFTYTNNLDQPISNILVTVLQNNETTPMILVYEDGEMKPNNIPEEKAKDRVYLQKKIKDFEQENPPLTIAYDGEVFSTLYYGDSEVLQKLKYYPIALLLIIFLFGTVLYFFFKTNKASEQNKLWAGMAKETAHQIGTPLSSLIGWNEILKTEQIDKDITDEIEKDIQRLLTITERFSKIGSTPKLDNEDIVLITKQAYDYLKARSSNLVSFDFEAPSQQIFVKMNPSLYHWTIENLVKNGIDAMKGKGNIHIKMIEQDQWVKILVSDTGKGIPKSAQKSIFNPGFTTKKRGWGLGLSLVKRIVEDYHNGRIKVLHSQKEVGTTMQIMLKKID